MLAILYVSAVSVALGQLKIVPIMEQVAQVTGVSLTKAGLLVSVFTLTGIIFAIPGGAFLSKLGAKNLFLVLMGTLVLGNIIGAVSYLFIYGAGSKSVNRRNGFCHDHNGYPYHD